jgi:hypothetical protein
MNTGTLERIEEVRSDISVGRGTCSLINEAYTDEELVTLFTEAKVTNKEEARRAAIDTDMNFNHNVGEWYCNGNH